MYEYKFIEIKSTSIMTIHFEEYQDIINEEAKNGWRFVNALPVKIGGYGAITTLGLVFEREKK